MMVNILSIGGGDNPATFEPMPCSKDQDTLIAVTYSSHGYLFLKLPVAT